jgi:membrane fusion protein, multidrug efflux system
VASDKAAIENFKAMLTYYTIVAPIDGRVGVITIKAGNSIKANDLPLATINQIKPIYVAFSLPQSELPAIRDAMSRGPVAVGVRAAGDIGNPVTGVIAFFDNNVDTTSGTINVRAKFENDDQRLWPGQFVNVTATTRVDENAVVVPPAAVQVGQDGKYVFVIKPDMTAEARPVTISRTVDGKSVVAKGLAEGERVVIDGQLRLTDGVRVEIRAANQAKPDPAS